MEHIFAAHLAEKQGVGEEELAVIRAQAARHAAQCTEEMKDDSEQHSAPAAAAAAAAAAVKFVNKRGLDMGMIESHVPKKQKRVVHGQVPQQFWSELDREEAQRYVSLHKIDRAEQGRSEKGQTWQCDEWRMRRHPHAKFREVHYQVQMLAYFASRPGAVMQQDMTVCAYPCDNLVCITPSHLYLCEQRKRGKKSYFLPPMDSAGRQLVQRSQADLLKAKKNADEEDTSWTQPTSISAALHMSAAQFACLIDSK
jgi:hypothetical protein